jgi:zinc protease
MLKKIRSLVSIVIILLLFSCEKQGKFQLKTDSTGKYAYEYVTNDPLKVRIYTLQNGLKVYLSQYKNEPRIQTQIAVKAGGKNDPAQNTGLAHYLEHIIWSAYRLR